MALLINNKEYAWGDIAVTLWGRPVLGITGIEYKAKQKKEARRGMGRKAKSIQYGEEEYEGTLTIMQSELIALNQAAKTKGYKNILGTDLEIVVSYQAGLIVTVDKICCASFTELPMSMKEGDLQAEIALPFVAMDIEYDITGVVLN